MNIYTQYFMLTFITIKYFYKNSYYLFILFVGLFVYLCVFTRVKLTEATTALDNRID